MNGPFPAELKFREDTGVVENIKHLMTGLKGNKINCFPRDQSLSYLQSWKSIKPHCNLGHQMTLVNNSARLSDPLTLYIFQ